MCGALLFLGAEVDREGSRIARKIRVKTKTRHFSAPHIAVLSTPKRALPEVCKKRTCDQLQKLAT